MNFTTRVGVTNHGFVRKSWSGSWEYCADKELRQFFLADKDRVAAGAGFGLGSGSPG